MLTIVTEYDSIEWTTGNPGPMQISQQGIVISSKNVVEIIADGAELDYIRQRFTNIPMAVSTPPGPPGGDTVIWRGDIAQFIADNCNE